MKRKRNIYRIMKRMTKNFWRNWKMASASRYHQVSNVRRGMKGARRLFLAMLYGLAALLVTACATKKELHEHHAHSVAADTIATEASHDRQAHHEQRDIDSIVTASVWAAMQEFARQEQERETVREHTETTQHADGSVTTTTDRTTDRAVTRQEQQRSQQQLRQMQQEMHSRIEQLDSAWSDRFAQLKTHYEQRDSSTTDMHKATGSAAAKREPWYVRLWNYIRTMATGILAVIILLWLWERKGGRI